MKTNFKRLLSLLIVLAVMFFAFASKTYAATAKLSVIWSNPGENCSEEVTFSWQSTVEDSTFKFALYDEPDWTNAQIFEVKGKQTNYFDTYSYKLAIDDLEPATAYKYQITSGDATSAVYKVTTASLASDFSFAWVSDIHTHTGSSNRITFANQLLQQINKDASGINLIVGTGDEVAYGGNKAGYEMLTSLTSNPSIQTMMWANVPGNHTYYDDGKSGLSTNGYFETMTNHPNNGYDSLSSSYWFIYNSVMFVMMDSLTIQKSATTIAAQQAWFKKVVSQNQGKFQYLFVLQHFPWLNALTGSLSTGYYSNYMKWYEIFDEYGVDVCLAGDYHTYYRSNRLYQNHVVDMDSKNGTIYMGNRQIGGRAAGGSYYIKENQNPEYYACRLDNTYSESSGCGYFKVTAKGIEWKMYDHQTLSVVDSCFIPAKRDINWASAKEEVVDSAFFTACGDTGYINFNTAYKGYVDKVSVLDAQGMATQSICPSKERSATLILKGLEANKTYEYNVEFMFADGTYKQTKLYGNTYGDYGEVYGFNILSDDSKVSAQFNYNLKNNVITKFEIYQDDKKVATITPDATGKYKGVLNDAKLDLNSEFTLYGKNDKDDVIYSVKKKYTLYGDINFNGTFDIKDIDSSFETINSGKALEGNALGLNDFNGDGIFDIGDVILMYQGVKANKTAMKENVYTVTFLDFDGNVISTQEVKENEDAVIPEFAAVTGYKYAYLSLSNKMITSDTVIKAIYKAD